MAERNAPQRGWRWKRTAVLTLLLLIGGAIVNIAVAWGCATSSSQLAIPGAVIPPENYEVQDLPRIVWLHERGFRGCTDCFFRVEVNTAPGVTRRTIDLGMNPLLNFVTSEGAEQWRERLERLKRQSPDVQDWRPSKRWSSRETWSGWPMRSMFGSVAEYPPEEQRFSAFSFSTRAGGGSSADFLPGAPVLRGFIINTLFYALLLWLLVFAPFTARCMIRRRRGVCAKCAYPVGVSPICTECGAAVRASSSPGD